MPRKDGFEILRELHLVLLERACEQDDLRAGLVLLQLAQDLEPILARHVDVEDQDVGAVAAHGGHSLLAIHAANDDLEVGLQLVKTRPPLDNECMECSQDLTERTASHSRASEAR